PYLLYRHVDATAINAILTPNPTTVVALRYGFNRFPNLTIGVALPNESQSLTSGAPGLAALGFAPQYISQIPFNYFPQITFSNAGFSYSNVGVSPGNFYS